MNNSKTTKKSQTGIYVESKPVVINFKSKQAGLPCRDTSIIAMMRKG